MPVVPGQGAPPCHRRPQSRAAGTGKGTAQNPSWRAAARFRFALRRFVLRPAQLPDRLAQGHSRGHPDVERTRAPLHRDRQSRICAAMHRRWQTCALLTHHNPVICPKAKIPKVPVAFGCHRHQSPGIAGRQERIPRAVTHNLGQGGIVHCLTAPCQRAKGESTRLDNMNGHPQTGAEAQHNADIGGHIWLEKDQVHTKFVHYLKSCSTLQHHASVPNRNCDFLHPGAHWTVIGARDTYSLAGGKGAPVVVRNRAKYRSGLKGKARVHHG